MTDPLTCDRCGDEFEEWEEVKIIQSATWDGNGLSVYESDYYHRMCYAHVNKVPDI